MKVYEYILRIKDQGTDKVKRFADSISSGKSKVDQFSGSMNNAQNSSNGFGSSLGFLTKYLGAAFLVAQLSSVTLKASELGREFEQTKISFETLIGSVEGGRSLLKQTVELGVVTPFTSRELQGASKILLGYGIAAQKIIPTLKVLGDISGGNAEKLRLLSLAYAQTQAAGRLMGQDLLQMVNSGFNPLQQISQKTGISMAVLKKKMEDGAISAKMVEAAFRSATQAGGRFFNMMDKQSQTFQGRLSTLQDKFEIWLTKLGQQINDKLSPYLDKAIQLLDRYIDPEGMSVRSSDKQTESFKNLYAVTQPLIKQYEKLIALQKGGKNVSKELLEVSNQLGKAIPLAVTSPLGSLKTTVDIDYAKTFVEEQDKLFKSLNQSAMDDVINQKNRILSTKKELQGINELVRSDQFGIAGLTKAQQKYFEGESDKEASLKLPISFRAVLKQGGHDNVLNALNVELTKLNEQALDLDEKLRKLRTDRVTAYLPGTTQKQKEEDEKAFDKFKDGIDNINSGGKHAVNVTVNVQKLVGIETVEKVIGETDIKELMRRLEKASIETLLRTVNSANQAANQ